MGRDWAGVALGEDVGDIGVDLQMKVEYDAANNPVYTGYNRQGRGDSDQNWIIYKLSYDGTNMVWKQRLIGRWSERASLNWS